MENTNVKVRPETTGNVRAETSSATGVGVSGQMIWAVIIISLGAHFVCLGLAHTTFAGEVWEHHPAHSAVEMAGAFVALWVAWILLLLERRGVGTSHNLWIAGALIGMGLLDGLHALVHTGPTFVWLHSVATFVGGGLLMFVWAPTNLRERVRPWWPKGIAVSALTFGIVFLLNPEATPTLLAEQEHGPPEFNFLAVAINIAGGLFMLAAAGRLIMDYERNRNVDDLMFALPCLLFGSAAIMFDYSHLWDLSWWGWHLLRLLAYAMALAYVVRAEWVAIVQLERLTTELALNASGLERSNKELEQFAYIASHDLRSPLRAIEHLATWIEEDSEGALNEESRKHLGVMRQRINRMEMLMDSLLQYSRVGRKEDAIRKVDLNELLRDVVFMLDGTDSFTFEISPTLPTLLAPRGALERVFFNLIGNAIKHHDRPEGRIEVGHGVDGGFHVFTVRDDGPGIPEEFHERVFGMFQTLQPRDKVEGSGMGLALVKKTVECFGGAVLITSSPGAGTTIQFTWPCRPVSQQDARN